MKKLFAFFLFLFLLGFFLYWQNNNVVLTTFKVKSNKVPRAFEGYKILQISDLHNKKFNDSILKKIEQLEPDIILITGDLVDSRRTDIEAAMTFVNQIKEIAPIYYVTGNHEARISSFPELQKQLAKAGVQELDNQSVLLRQDDEIFELIGLTDLNFFNQNQMTTPKIQLEATLEKLSKQNDYFKLLLAHRPELFDLYAKSSVDLVLSGHAHGGQIRLPILGGLFAPNQGFLPQYSEGLHESNETLMIVSRGLGNSLFPFRIFNRPELVMVTLKSGKP